MAEAKVLMLPQQWELKLQYMQQKLLNSDSHDLLKKVLPATISDYVEYVKLHLAAGQIVVLLHVSVGCLTTLMLQIGRLPAHSYMICCTEVLIMKWMILGTNHKQSY